MQLFTILNLDSPGAGLHPVILITQTNLLKSSCFVDEPQSASLPYMIGRLNNNT